MKFTLFYVFWKTNIMLLFYYTLYVGFVNTHKIDGMATKGKFVV